MFNNNNNNIMALNNQINQINNNNMLNFQNRNVYIENNKGIKSNTGVKNYECPKCHEKIEERLKEDHKLSHRIDEIEKINYHRRHSSRDNRYFRQMNNNMNNNRPNRYIININPPANNQYSLRNIENNFNNYRNNFGQMFATFVNRFYNDRTHHINHTQLAFPEIVIEDVNKLDEGNKSCTICLEEFQQNEKVIALPCLHYFHKKCIKKWMERKKECPICKFELTKKNIEKKMKNIYH